MDGIVGSLAGFKRLCFGKDGNMRHFQAIIRKEKLAIYLRIWNFGFVLTGQHDETWGFQHRRSAFLLSFDFGAFRHMGVDGSLSAHHGVQHIKYSMGRYAWKYGRSAKGLVRKWDVEGETG
jgi:hypothetical protein